MTCISGQCGKIETFPNPGSVVPNTLCTPMLYVCILIDISDQWSKCSMLSFIATASFPQQELESVTSPGLEHSACNRGSWIRDQSSVCYFSLCIILTISRTTAHSWKWVLFPTHSWLALHVLNFINEISISPEPVSEAMNSKESSALSMLSRGRGFESHEGCAIFQFMRFRLFQEQVFTFHNGAIAV